MYFWENHPNSIKIKITMKSEKLIQDSFIDWIELGDGIRRKVMAQNESMMIVKVDFEQHAIGTLHHHPHTQASYVSKGKFEITIGSEKSILESGDVYFVPTGEVHGAVCLEKGELIDVFSPRRDDFL
jgi:quercetin dioxygenase-like cupin family protein